MSLGRVGSYCIVRRLLCADLVGARRGRSRVGALSAFAATKGAMVVGRPCNFAPTPPTAWMVLLAVWLMRGSEGRGTFPLSNGKEH